MTLSRRALLLGGGTTALVGCGNGRSRGGRDGGSARPDGAPSAPIVGARRFRYGGDPSQFAELRMPEGPPRATVVLVHGGAWLAQYGVEQMVPLGRALNRDGFATWNLEYRRIGLGGGIPATLTDVALGIDRLAGPGLPRDIDRTVVVVGHSAGGHLAAWAASRSGRTPGGPARVGLRGVVSLAGILDLSGGARDPQVGQIVTNFAGGAPDDVPRRYAQADPTLLVPASCPVWAVVAEGDQLVPLEQAERYVARTRAAGGTSRLVRVPGDHSSLIDPNAASYPRIRTLLLAAR